MDSVLRRISANVLDGDSIPTTKFLSGNTKNDLAEAECDYQKWREAQVWSIDEDNAEFDAVSGYLSATEQYYHEQGIRYGIRLMYEVMTGLALGEDAYRKNT